MRLPSPLSVILLLALGALTACARPSSPPPAEPPPVSGGVAGARSTGPVALRPGHPQRYTVVPGDTLLDVAGRFLQKPWRWHEVWRPESGREDSQALYPGEVIELYYEDGQPRLRSIATGEVPLVKLSPQVRVEALVEPIPVVPRNAIDAFLQRSIVVSEAEWEAAPYIIGGADERFILGLGDQAYARGIDGTDLDQYRIFRLDRELKAPGSGRTLGFNGLYVGRAAVQEPGNPTRLVLTDSRSDVRRGDRLFPPAEENDIYLFNPRPAPPDSEGQIIALLGDALVASLHQTVVVNLGSADSVEPGHMLGVFKKDRDMEDPLTGATVPVSSEQRIALLMLYQVYDRVSYALITEVSGPVRILDRVAAPEP